MNLYRKCIAKPYSFLVTDATIALDNPLQLRKNLIERILKLITTINDKIIKHMEKLINMNVLQVKKYYLRIKEE